MSICDWFKPYRRFRVYVKYSGLHPYLTYRNGEGGTPGKRIRDFPDRYATFHIEAKSFEQAKHIVWNDPYTCARKQQWHWACEIQSITEE